MNAVGRSPDRRPGGDPSRPPLQRVREDRMRVTGVGSHHKKLSVVVAQGPRKSAMLLSLPGQRAMRRTLREDGGERSGGKPLPPAYTDGTFSSFTWIDSFEQFISMNQFKELIQWFFKMFQWSHPYENIRFIFLLFIYLNSVCLSLVCCSHDWAFRNTILFICLVYISFIISKLKY